MGLGLLVGYSVSAGTQLVADSQGNIGIAFTFAGAGPFPVLGVGAQGGVQVSASTAKTIYDLQGDSLDFNASAGNVGLDVSKGGGGGPTTGTLTLGPGVGGKTAAMGLSNTFILLSTNCSHP